MLSSLSRAWWGLILVPGRGTKIPQAVSSQGKIRKSNNGNNNIKPYQNGSTFRSVLTKAVHVIINTPNFSSPDGEQKMDFIKISTGHKYVTVKQTRGGGVCDSWLCASDHILAYLDTSCPDKSLGVPEETVC